MQGMPIRRVATLTAIVGLIAAACSSGGTPSPAGSGGGGDFSGKTITVLGAFVDASSGGGEATEFANTVKPFEDKTGAKVQYEGTKQFETLINTRVQAGNPPDVAAIPQPGLMNHFAELGALKALPQSVITNIDANYASPAWKALASYNGTVYGVFHRVNVKGLFFYPKKVWAAKGYTPPTTNDELTALEQKMISNGDTPFCVGIESGSATGWYGTDWIEQLVLHTYGPDVYNQWVQHKVTFQSDQIKQAWTEMGNVWFNKQMVYGGTATILQTNYGDAPTPMFADPAKCMMIMQGNFITGFFPKDVQANIDADVGVFAYPTINTAYTNAVEAGGDQFVMFNDRPEVEAFLAFLATPEAGVSWQKAGGALFAYKGQDFSLYKTDIERNAAKTLATASDVVFDASDSMPAAVGNGSFWKGVVDYVTQGPSSLDGILKTIDNSWPSS